MPHLTLEHTAPLPAPVDVRAVLAALHGALAALGIFRLEEIKSRAVEQRLTCVGAGAPTAVFVHLTVAILSGREADVRKRISDTCLAALRQHFAPVYDHYPCDLTVEVREMERGSYGKAMNDLARHPPAGPAPID